jgi:outer membrane protein assembly complex protein YaeT
MVTRQVTVTALVVCFAAGAGGASAKDEASRDVLRDADTSIVEATRPAIIDDIEFTGLRRVAPEALKAQIASRAGEPLNRARLASDVRVLALLGWFASIRVETEDSLEAPDVNSPRSPGVHLHFYVQENPFLTNVEFDGSQLLSRQQIDKLIADKKIMLKLGEPENPATLHAIAVAIRSALAELGHPEARVEVQRTELRDATVQVRFNISDGPHVTVGRITFEGNIEVSSRLLRRQMRRIRPSALFTDLRGTNAYTREAFAEDRERILAYYQNHGYPEARIGDERIAKYQEFPRKWFPWQRKSTLERLNVRIPIEAGPFYRLESVKASDALAQAATARKVSLVAFSETEPGRVYSARAIENLRRVWQGRVQPKPGRSKEESFQKVEAIRTLDVASCRVRIFLDFSSIPPYRVRRLDFRGMHHFPDRYFRSRIYLREGAAFDDRLLEAGLARLARTGYFKPIKKEDVRVVPDEASHSVDVTIHVEEIGQQRASLVGGRGQFGSTLGIAYTVFNLLDREELISSRIEGGPESVELAIGFAKEGFLGSRGSLALSVFDTLLRPRLSGSVKGPFFKQQTEGVDAAWNYRLSTTNSLSIDYNIARSKTQYSAAIPPNLTGLAVSDATTETSSHAGGLGWTHDTGNERISFADSVSGGWLGSGESVVRSKTEFARVFRDPILDHDNSWAFRTSFAGVGSYAGNMPLYARLFSGDEFVRGLRPGALGPEAVVSSVAPTSGTKYSATPAGANLVGAANAEYRVRLASGTEATGFFDLGSGMLLPNWLGQTRPALLSSTNAILHGSTGIQLQWTVPEVGVPLRAYYALNVLRLNRWFSLPDDSLFHAHDRFSAFGWGLGSLF